MKNVFRIIIPLAILGLAAAAWAVMYRIAEEKPPEPSVAPVLPLVEVIHAQSRDITLSVKTCGTVTPRTETILMPEVSGKIIRVSPSFYAGGFFRAGEVLLEIEPVDYAAALAQAEASLARAQVKLVQEKALSAQAEKDWRELGKGKPSPLVLRKPQLAEAAADVKSAGAEVEKAGRDLERTRIRAPYPGMVREKNVDIGQFVSTGNPLCTIFAVDFALVRLPVTSGETAFLDLPDNCRQGADKSPLPGVELFGDVAGETVSWSGEIIRTEGAFDPAGRVMYVVAQIPDPYGINKKNDSFKPLRMGLFVEAQIRGITVKDAVVIPSHAVHGADTIRVVDQGGKLHTRKIRVLRMDDRQAVIKAGLDSGEKICVTALEYVTEGMSVETREQTEGDRS